MTDYKFENRSKISYTFLRIISKLTKFNSETRNYGTDKPLHEAEIHMIKSIKENEGIHITALAEMLGITKGAVSQISIKLEKKGMIIKVPDPANLSRLQMKLTEKGEIAHRYHLKLHKMFDDSFYHIVNKLTEEEKAVLRKFLNDLDNEMIKILKKEI
ncbi:MarR family winged helix-turn-helix transcriptional regulator [Candidatus Izemoplasma sp. B36]|uniref:MarR family winged helix-turn-helix transcriptional regulator n=1 Tax=Candidatus Izemoplasma sp. B36 TaxID=3242468 RepID=UPI003557BBBB